MTLIWLCRLCGSQKLHLMASSFSILPFNTCMLHISMPNEFRNDGSLKCSCFPRSHSACQHNFRHSLWFSNDLSFGDSVALMFWRCHSCRDANPQGTQAHTHTRGQTNTHTQHALVLDALPWIVWFSTNQPTNKPTGVELQSSLCPVAVKYCINHNALGYFEQMLPSYICLKNTGKKLLSHWNSVVYPVFLNVDESER